jgi:hypothetical protein
LDELVRDSVVVSLGDRFQVLVHLISEYYQSADRYPWSVAMLFLEEIKQREEKRGQGGSAAAAAAAGPVVALLTCGLVFRVRFYCAFSSFDSYALERRLGSGLLLRHPQISNQNSKKADSIRGGVYAREILRASPLPQPSFLFWMRNISIGGW